NERPRTGVGQKSPNPASLIGLSSLRGACHGSLTLVLSATQMSFGSWPRFEAKKRLRPSGDSNGQPSAESASLTGPTGSAFVQRGKGDPPSGQPCAPAAVATTKPMTSTAAPAPVALRHSVDLLLLAP